MKSTLQPRHKLFAVFVSVASLLLGLFSQVPIANAEPAPFTSAPFTTSSTTTKILLTATSGSFDPDNIQQQHFTFRGADENALEAATLTYVSPTIVAVGGLTGMIGGSDNTVEVKVPAQLTKITGLIVESVVGEITTTAILGVNVPATGGTPDTTVDTTSQYSGSVSWSPSDSPFMAGETYTATITLTPQPGYTFTGISANFFTVPGSVSATNPAGSGVVTAIFPSTAYAEFSEVTFLGNGSTSGAMDLQRSNVPTALNLNTFIRTGYSFSGWNTTAGGTGIAIADGATYSFAESITLYAQWSVLPNHNVTFDGNGATSGMMETQTANVPTALNTNTFLRTGYSFVGWNTTAGGSGIAIADGATYSFATDITLYAQWEPLPVRAVAFDGNGATSGTMETQTANVPTALTANSFVRTGYTFAGWNTLANGLGQPFADGAQYGFTANVTLYAQWAGVISYTVTFNGNSSDGGATAPQSSDTPTALTTNGFTRTGYSFTGWNTAADGTGISYSQGVIYSFAASITLYAQWVALANHTVSFDGNGATGGSTVAQTTNVPTALTSNGFTRSGYSFNNWNTAANGSGTTYANGAVYSFASDLTLYAQWNLVPVIPPSGGGGGVFTATVIFDGNGAGGTTAQSSSVPAALLVNSFNRPGFTFTGWNTASNGTGIAYANGATYPFTSNVTLYAQWSAIRTVTFIGNGSDSGATSAQLASTPTALIANGFARSGYTFTSWNTSADGTGTLYANGATYSFASDLTLYAQWVVLTYTVTFDGNGANSGSTPAQTSSIAASLISNGFTRSGYNFAGWNTVAAGGGTAYANGASYNFAADITLYAQWTAAPIITATIAGETTVLANEAKTFNVLVEGANGQLIPIAIDLPAGVTGVNGRVRVSPIANAESLALGLLTIQVQVLDEFGNVIPTLLAPIVIRFINELGEYIVAKSEDGLIWTPLPLITGTTLPEGVTDGYYVDANGQIIILTRGLSQFGLKAPQSTLQLSSKSSRLVIRAKTSVAAAGGKGTGPLLYSTSTPTICKISSSGVVSALKLGTCRTTTIKAGDAIYINTQPASKTLTVVTATGAAARPILNTSGKAASKRIYLNLGSGYANQEVLLKVRVAGSTTYRTIGKVTLNGVGRFTTRNVVATNSTLQVASGSKALAVIKVTGK